jgi:hypothetical protein
MNDSNRHFRRGAALLCLLLFCGGNYATAGAPPVVSNVRAAQRAGTQLVDIYYDLARLSLLEPRNRYFWPRF